MKPTPPPTRAPARPTRPSVIAPAVARAGTRPSIAPTRAPTGVTAAPMPAPPDPVPPPPPKTTNEILARLIALTPEPDPDLEVDQLLAVFDTMLVQRAQLIGELAAPPPGAMITLDGAGRQLHGELARRETAWRDLLASALRLVGDQRRSVSKLRAYGGAP
jgi:hypothetical protein